MQLLGNNGQPGSCSGPEVGFEDIVRRFPRSPCLDSFRFAAASTIIGPIRSRCAAEHSLRICRTSEASHKQAVHLTPLLHTSEARGGVSRGEWFLRYLELLRRACWPA